MSTLERVAVTFAVVASPPILTFTPALFSARYRTPARITASLAIAVLAAALVYAFVSVQVML